MLLVESDIAYIVFYSHWSYHVYKFVFSKIW